MKTIKELIAEKDRFLEEHPHLVPMQRGLDQIMEGMTPLERCQYLSKAMSRNLVALSKNLGKLV